MLYNYFVTVLEPNRSRLNFLDEGKALVIGDKSGVELEGRRGDDRIGEPEIVLFPQIDRSFFDLSGYVYDRDIVQKPLELMLFLRGYGWTRQDFQFGDKRHGQFALGQGIDGDFISKQVEQDIGVERYLFPLTPYSPLVA